MTGNKIRDPRNNQLASLHIITDPILSPVMWKRKQYRTFRTWNAGNQRNWQASIKHRVWRLTAQMCLQASGQMHTSTWRPAWHSEARPWADYVPMSRGISDRASGHISLPRQSIITTTDQNSTINMVHGQASSLCSGHLRIYTWLHRALVCDCVAS